MKWPEVPAGTLNAAQQRFWSELGSDASRVADRLISDDLFRNQVVRFIKSNCLESTTNPNRARKIMGKNFFGPEEAIKHFGANLWSAPTTKLDQVPFTEKVLQSVKDTHILAAVFPLSILELRERIGRELFYPHQTWYREDEEAFAKERGEVEWHLIRKTELPDSHSKNWNDQLDLLGEYDVVPTSRVLTYTIIGHRLATGELLFDERDVRTASVDSRGNCIGVGMTRKSELTIHAWSNENRFGFLGLANEWKPN